MPEKTLDNRSSPQRRRSAKRPGRLVAVVFVALLAAALAPGAAEQETRPSDGFLVAKGRTTFRIYCANCHGPKGLGNGAVAEMLKVPPADLTVLARKSKDGKFPREEVHAAIDGREWVRGHGSRDMPIWGDAFQKVLQPGYQEMSDEERAQLKIVELVYFLESIQQPAEP